MATEKYPNQNVNIPYKKEDVERARARLDPGNPGPASYSTTNSNGKGSKRSTRQGEWFDDRVINIGGPSSPSKDSPPEIKFNTRSGKAVPASFDPAIVYSVILGKPAVFAGRTLSPAKEYIMAGYACTEIQTASPASIVDAMEVGTIPADPDATPSSAKKG